MNNDAADLPLSDDPEENMRMENELLRLKLKAELGGESLSMGTLPPEIENEFLKNVLAFEHNYAHSKRVKVYELLGNPDFTKAGELSDAQLEQALQLVTDLLTEKNIAVYFGDDDEYDSRIRYQFITEELFEKECDGFIMPGMTMHYDYEEFHPNHKKDIERAAIKFLEAWFARSIEAVGWELASQAILPDRKILSKDDLLARIKNIFDAYTSFKDEKHDIFDIAFDMDAGMGHAEGGAIYRAVLENGETIVIKGPFKLYFSFEFGYWSIVYMVFPGFEYF